MIIALDFDHDADIIRVRVADFGPWPCVEKYDVCCQGFYVSLPPAFPLNNKGWSSVQYTCVC